MDGGNPLKCDGRVSAMVMPQATRRSHIRGSYETIANVPHQLMCCSTMAVA